eukprot:1676840-Amphidinium_carterae.1
MNSGTLCPKVGSLAFLVDCAWKFAGLAVYNPQCKAKEFYLQTTLPCGATASVLAFNRVARVLWFLGCRVSKTLWTSYFDDFSMLDLGLTSRAGHLATESLLDCLDWVYAKGEKKRKDFSEIFCMLGAVLDLLQLHAGTLLVHNRDDR